MLGTVDKWSLKVHQPIYERLGCSTPDPIFSLGGSSWKSVVGFLPFMWETELHTLGLGLAKC